MDADPGLSQNESIERQSPVTEAHQSAVMEGSDKDSLRNGENTHGDGTKDVGGQGVWPNNYGTNKAFEWNESTGDGKGGVQTMPDEEGEKKAKHKEYLSQLGQRWFTVEPVIIIYITMFTCQAPLLQQYIHERMSIEYNITDTVSENLTEREACLLRGQNGTNVTSNEAAFQEEVAMWTIWILVAILIPTVFVVFIIGTISDHRGRRLAIVPQIVVQAIAYAISTIVMALDLNLVILVLTGLLQGFTGASTVVFMACYSYIADINPPEKRLFRIVLIEVGQALGALVGGLLIGWMTDSFGFVIPSIVLTVLMGVLSVYVIFFIPETVLKDPNAPVFKCSYLSGLPKLWFKKGTIRGTLPIIWLCFSVIVFNHMLGDGTMLVTTLYLLDPPLCWNATLIGIYNGVGFLIKAVGCMVLMKLLHDRVNSTFLAMIGVVSLALSYICLGLATDEVLPFIGLVLACASLLVAPVCRSISSAKVPDNLQGALFSGLGFGQMLAILIGAPVVNTVYGETPVSEHGYIYIGSAAACVITMALVIWLYFVDKKYTEDNVKDNVEGNVVADNDDLNIKT